MLTCAIHPSTNPCCCSSPIWKPSKWPSASPVWSSRRWQRSVKHSVSFSVLSDCSVPLSLLLLLGCRVSEAVTSSVDSSSFHILPDPSHRLPFVPSQTSEDQRNFPCWSLQMIPPRKKRRKTRTHWMTSGTSIYLVGDQEAQVLWNAGRKKVPNLVSKVICSISEKIQANTQIMKRKRCRCFLNVSSVIKHVLAFATLS